jgi:hypothetical protein
MYVGAVIAAGAAVLVAFAPRELPRPAVALTFLAAMAVVSLFKLRLPLGRGNATMSMAYVVDFAVLVTAGVELAMVIAAIGTLVQCTVNVRKTQPWYRTAFSVAAVVLSVGAAGWAWLSVGGTALAPGAGAAAVPLLVAGLFYFAVNTALVATAVAMSSGVSPIECWQENFVRTAPGYVAAAGLVAVIAAGLSQDAVVMLVSAAVPTALCHLAYVAWFRRVTARREALA